MKFPNNLLLVATAVVLSGCASTPSTEISPAKTKINREEKITEPTKKNKKTYTIEIEIPSEPDPVPEPVAMRSSRFSQANWSPVLAETPKSEPKKPELVAVVGPDGKTVWVPKGGKVKFKVEDDVENKGGESWLKTDGEASSAGMKTSSDEAAGKFSAQSPDLNVSGLDKKNHSSGSGGGLDFKFDISSAAQGGPVFMFVFGAIVMVIGAFCGWWKKSIILGAGGIGTGLLIIGAAVVAQTYPWVYLFCLLGVIGVLAYLVYEIFTGGDEQLFAKTLVKAVEKKSNGEDAPGDIIKAAVEAEVGKSTPIRARVDRVVNRYLK